MTHIILKNEESPLLQVLQCFSFLRNTHAEQLEASNPKIAIVLIFLQPKQRNKVADVSE